MNWQNPNRLFTLAGAALLIAMFPYAPTPTWACSVGGAASFSQGSENDANALTVCVKSTVTAKVVLKPPKPVPPKPVPPKPVPAKPSPPKPIVKAPAPVAGPPVPKAPAKSVTKTVASPKPITKPTAKPLAPPVKTTSSTASAEARFTPAPVSILASDLSPEVAESVDFSVEASVHFRSATLLGKAAEVKFTPAGATWGFGDGISAGGQSIEHLFNHPGAYLVTVRVTYEATYRISGATDWLSGGQLSVSNQVTLSVRARNEQPQNPETAQSKKVFLVAKNCIIRKQAVGCSL